MEGLERRPACHAAAGWVKSEGELRAARAGRLLEVEDGEVLLVVVAVIELTEVPVLQDAMRTGCSARPWSERAWHSGSSAGG